MLRAKPVTNVSVKRIILFLHNSNVTPHQISSTLMPDLTFKWPARYNFGSVLLSSRMGVILDRRGVKERILLNSRTHLRIISAWVRQSREMSSRTEPMLVFSSPSWTTLQMPSFVLIMRRVKNSSRITASECVSSEGWSNALPRKTSRSAHSSCKQHGK